MNHFFQGDFGFPAEFFFGFGGAALPRGPLLERTLEAVRAVSTCSDAVRTALLRRFPGQASRARTIWNGIPLPAAEPPPLPETPSLLFVGRLSPEKGADLAIAALEHLATAPDLHLVLAGDGPERTSLEAQAVRRGVADRVRFAGWVPPARVRSLLAASTVLLVPSRSEGLGIAAIEAGAHGRPVVAARVGGLPEVVEDGVTGILVEPESPGALAEAVARLLDDPALARRMGRAARRRVRQRFSIARCADAYEELYAAVLDGEHRPVPDGRG